MTSEIDGEGGPNDWMYQQVIEAIAIFASHGNSGMSAPWEIDLVKRLCNWDINNIDLIKLDINYNIQWEECSCLKGIRLEDVTEELEDIAYEEMRHN